MKKIIAILLSLSIFGSVGMAFDTDSLLQLGVKISSEETKLVLRKEFIANLINYINLPLLEDRNQVFNDVPPELDYYKEINAAYDAGFIVGTSNLTFEPEKPILYSDAIRILIKILGYDAFVDAGNSYSAVASGIGLSDGVEVLDNGWFDHGSMARLFSNLTDIPTVQVRYDGVTYTYNKDGETLIEKYRDSSVKVGLVQCVDGITLQDNFEVNGEYIMIGGGLYSTNGRDLSEYFGKLVEFVYNEEMSKIEAISPVKKCKEINLELRDVNSCENFRIYYDNESGKEKHASFNSSTIIVYNSKPISIFDPQLLMGESGKIKLIDNDSDGNMDVIIVDKYEDFLVGSIDTRNKVLYEKYKKDEQNNALRIDASALDKSCIINELGNVIELEQITRDSIVSVMRTDSGEIAKLILCVNTKTGMASTLGLGDSSVIVDGTKLYITRDCIDNFTIKVGEKYKFYLNAAGLVSAVDPVDTGNVSYGYIIKIWDSLEDEATFAKILSSNGAINRHQFAEKITLDGVRRGYKHNEILSALSDGSGFLPQIIRYSVNSSSKITMLDTAGAMNESGSLSLVEAFPKTSNMKYRSTARSFAGKLLIEDNVPVFRIPDESDPAVRGTFEEKMYSVTTHSSLSDEKEYTVAAYATNDEAYTIEAFAVYESAVRASTMYESVNFSVISGLSQILNSEGEVVDVIDYYLQGKPYSRQVASEDVLPDCLPDGVELKIGDVVRFEFDELYRIKYVDYIHSPEGRALDDSVAKLSGGTINSPLNQDSYRVYALGHVYKQMNGNVYLAKKSDIISNPSLGLENRVAYRASSVSVVIYDPDASEKVSLGSLSDLIETSGTIPGDMVLIKVYLGALQTIYVIRG